MNVHLVRGVADKSLALPGKQQATTRLNWATQFSTVAYDGACSPNVSVRMA